VSGELALVERVQRFEDDVATRNVPARSEAGLVERKRRTGVRNDLIAVPHGEAGVPSDVDSVIGAGGVL